MFTRYYVKIRSQTFQILSVKNTDTNKIYFHVDDVARVLNREKVNGWIKAAATCTFGQIYPTCGSLLQFTWAIEKLALMNLLHTMGADGAELLDLLWHPVYENYDLSSVKRADNFNSVWLVRGKECLHAKPSQVLDIYPPVPELLNSTTTTEELDDVNSNDISILPLSPNDLPSTINDLDTKPVDSNDSGFSTKMNISDNPEKKKDSDAKPSVTMDPSDIPENKNDSDAKPSVTMNPSDNPEKKDDSDNPEKKNNSDAEPSVTMDPSDNPEKKNDSDAKPSVTMDPSDNPEKIDDSDAKPSVTINPSDKCLDLNTKCLDLDTELLTTKSSTTKNLNMDTSDFLILETTETLSDSENSSSSVNNIPAENSLSVTCNLLPRKKSLGAVLRKTKKCKSSLH